jgi:ribosomal protein L11 methyltransferase
VEWRQLVMHLASLDPDRVESALMASGALSVTFTDAADNPVLEPAPGETPLWADTLVTALFDDATNLQAVENHLTRALEIERLPTYRVETLADRDWEREWLKDFGPMAFGERLWVLPTDTPAPVADAVIVRLDPGLAFGTGTHPTTALCLEWLDQAPVDGMSVLDFGCGSGILAVAALKLGASTLVGVDIDPQAMTATRVNAERNAVSDRLSLDTGMPDDSFDIVLANILAGTLIDHRDRLCAATKPGGTIVLSGILGNQVEDVRRAFSDNVVFDPPSRRDDWALLSGRRT